MAEPGEVNYHSLFGVRLRFLQTAAQTNGNLFRWRSRCRQDSRCPSICTHARKSATRWSPVR